MKIACGLVLLATLAAYSNHFRNDFHFDDSHTIQNNAFIRRVGNIPRFFTDAATFSSKPANQSYRPLVTTTLTVDYWAGGGLNPLAFHVTSFGLFLLQCALMLVLFRRVMDLAHPDGANRWLALLAVAWYALHPVNAETVNYIIARSEILSTLGVVAALVLFSGDGAARRYHLYLVPAFLGILSRESGAMFAPLLLVYAALFEPKRPLFRAVLPALLVCAATGAFAVWMAPAYSPGGASRWHYLLTQPFVIVHYAISLLLPLRLSADTQWPLVETPLSGRVLAGVVFIAAALWAARAAARRAETRPIAFGILWFFIALLPTSGLVPLSEPMNDHRMYFPFVGLILAVVWAAGLALEKYEVRSLKYERSYFVPRTSYLRPVAIAAAVAMILAMAYGTRQRNIVWRTEESLWLDATIKSPDNGRGLMNYGVIQMEHGRLAVADDYFTRALRYKPDYAYLHVNVAILKVAQGRPAEAERHFREALQDDPRNPISYTHYARWLASIGRTVEARLYAEAAVKMSPADADARALLDRLTTPR